MKTDEELRQALRSASTPEPVGGHEVARERALSRVRHRFPSSTERALPRRSLLRPLVATVAMASVVVALFLAWPEQAAEADSLPSEAQMSQFYDQHDTHHAAHLRDEAQEVAR